MSEKITRRDFLKLSGAGAAAAAVLTGCGPVARYVTRRPYTEMPEYTLPGQSTYYATTCRECPAGCGLIVRTVEGRAIKVEGNPNHPVNRGRTCPRGQATLQGLYNPDRIQGPQHQAQRGSGQFESLDWETAIGVVQQALAETAPDGIAFLLGLNHDHLFDLVSEITAALGAPAPLRFGALGMLEGRATLIAAAGKVLGKAALPHFDIRHAEMTISFGANFLETWLSPVAFGNDYGAMRRGEIGQRGYLVHFEPRLSQTAANADEWFPITPGTEGLVAQALGALVAEALGQPAPKAFAGVDVAAVAEQSGVAEADLRRLAGMFARASRKVAIPGGAALGHTNGLQTAQAILALNALVDNLGQPGGVSFLSEAPVHPETGRRPATFAQIARLVKQMQDGQVKVLFIHGVNPAYELPAALGFAEALQNVPLVISFASFPDETAQLADYVFPDHTPLEGWGYQKVAVGADRAVVSGAQPVVVPLYDTRATADVLLAAVQAIGGDLAKQVPYKDEVDFIQQSVTDLLRAGGFYAAAEIKTFMARFQQFGGWWTADTALEAPQSAGLDRELTIPAAEFDGEGEFFLFTYPSPTLSDGSGANRPWLQETPDPMTTVMWNSWVEINPETARELGLRNDDVVRITSPYGTVEAVVYVYPAIRPDTIAIPLGQGHTALGRFAEGRGVNPLTLLGAQVNAAGGLAFAATRVKIEKTGRRRQLARYENRVGVYGDGA